MDVRKLVKLASIYKEAAQGRLVAIPGLQEKSQEFLTELINVGKRLNIDPSFIAAVMKSESGFNHQAVNQMGGATGLIQFMPSTAKAFGTTTEELKNMSDVEQLHYVEKFFKPYAGKIRTPGDLYMATFLPLFVGKPNDFIIGQKGNTNPINKGDQLTFDQVYRYNAGFDTDKDGIIRVKDVANKANSIFVNGWKNGVVDISKAPAQDQTTNHQDNAMESELNDLGRFLFS